MKIAQLFPPFSLVLAMKYRNAGATNKPGLEIVVGGYLKSIMGLFVSDLRLDNLEQIQILQGLAALPQNSICLPHLVEYLALSLSLTEFD